MSDQESNTSGSDNERNFDVFVLLSYKDHDREAKARSPIEQADIRKLVDKTFADLPSSSNDCRLLKYKSEQWEGRWLDVTSNFSWSSRRLEIQVLDPKLAHHPPDAEPQQQKKIKLMDAIKLMQQKGGSKKRTNIRETVSCGIGWKEYEPLSKCYKQVRSQCGGGTLSLTVNRRINYNTLMELCKEKFFPNGRSANGIRLETREFYLGNNQGMSFEDSFVFEELYKETPKLKLYLHSKQIERESSESSSLPDPGLFTVDDSDIEDLSTYWPVNDHDNSDAPVVVEDANVHTSTTSGGSGTVQTMYTGQHFVSAGTPTVQVKTSGAPMCTVCLVRAKDAFIGCGHTFCGPCLFHLLELQDDQQPSCPQCRAPFDKVQTLYF